MKWSPNKCSYHSHAKRVSWTRGVVGALSSDAHHARGRHAEDAKSGDGASPWLNVGVEIGFQLRLIPSASHSS